MAYPVTLNGRTYTLADFEGTNYVEGLPDAFEDFVTHAGDIYNSTSTTSNSIGTGSKTFTVESAKPYQAGTPLRIADAAAPSTNFMDTIVTSYSGTTLVVDSVGYAGSGTFTSWNVNIGGAASVAGTVAIAQGGTGATTAAAARTNLDVYSKADADSRFLNVSGEASDVSITGDLTVDTDTFVVDGTNDLIGVGTASPAPHNANGVAIQIDGGSNASELRLTNTTTGAASGNGFHFATVGNKAYIVQNESDDLYIYANGNEILRFNSSNQAVFGASADRQVLIGATDNTNATDATLILENNTQASTHGKLFIASGTTTPGTNLGLGFVGFGDANKVPSAFMGVYADGGWTSGSDMPTRMAFFTTADGASSASERMRITNDGDVNFGVSNARIDSTGIVKAANGSESAPGVSFINDPDNGMFRATTNTLAFATAGSEAMRIDSSQRVLIGTTASNTTISANPALQVAGTTYDKAMIGAYRYDDGAGSPAHLTMSKSRGTSVNTQTIVQSGDTLGQVNFAGSDGTTFRAAAYIQGFVDGTPGSNDMPGRLVFSTTKDGANTPTEAMRIEQNQRLRISTSNNTGALTSYRTYTGEGAYIAGSVNGGGAGPYPRYLDLVACGDSSWGGIIRFVSNRDSTATAEEVGRFDRSGNFLVGKDDSNFGTAGIALMQTAQLRVTRNGAVASFNRIGSNGDVAEFYGPNGLIGRIRSEGDDLVVGTNGDCGIRFNYTNATGADFVAPCRNTGALRDNAIDLGTGSGRWDDVYATNGTIQTSDQNEKQQIASLTDAEITAAKAISQLFKTFKWNDSVAEKGDAARTHSGVIAQDVEQAMSDAGLNAGDYAFFISTTWWELDETFTDDDGVESIKTNHYFSQDDAPEGATERNRKGIRYPELLSFIGAATEQRLASIEARLDALET